MTLDFDRQPLLSRDLLAQLSNVYREVSANQLGIYIYIYFIRKKIVFFFPLNSIWFFSI